MFAVLFEVQPRTERFDDYLSLAKQLKPVIEAIDGFIDNERFRSIRDPRWLLSLSTWRDEKALVRWRVEHEHHAAQEKGRFEVFEDYHLRVGEIVSDTDPQIGRLKQQRFDETETGAAKFVAVTEITPAPGQDAASLAAQLGFNRHLDKLVACDAFESIAAAGKLVFLSSWQDGDAANAFHPARPHTVQSFRHRTIRVIRDYGMFERREAPQFYPEAARER